jgi:hypothetical protein
MLDAFVGFARVHGLLKLSGVDFFSQQQDFAKTHNGHP